MHYIYRLQVKCYQCDTYLPLYCKLLWTKVSAEYTIVL